jgi:hypothetical protein
VTDATIRTPRGAYGVKLVRGPFVRLAPHPFACSTEQEFLDYAAQCRERGDRLAADLFCGAGGLSLGLTDALILPTGSNRVVIIVDKEGAQSIYPGIGDNPTVTGPLPGRRLVDEGIDVAVVRLALGPHAARPATAFRPSNDLDTMKPSYQRRILFVHDHNGEPGWLLTQDSHQHQGAKSPQRLGTSHSREDFGEIAASHMGKDMHATGRVEITIPSPACWDRGDLAILIARLCEQTLSWDHRTSRAVPLHLGYTADKDHPDYGSHDAGGEADDDEREEQED